MAKTLSLLLAIAICAAAAVPATAPAVLPALRAADLALLHRLESGNWHDRKAAQAELAAQGYDNVPLVRAMLAQTSNPEAQTRLNAVLALWAKEKLLGPSLITLHMKNTPAKEAYAELFRQADATFRIAPENLFDSVGPVSIDADRQPFWVVMQQLEHMTNVGFNRGLDGISVLSRGNLVISGQQAIDGQFLIVAAAAQQTWIPTNPGEGKIIQLNLAVYAEPKTYVMSSPPMMKVDRVTDNHGNAVSEAPQAGGVMAPGMIAQGPCAVFLRLATKNPGDAISAFRATLTLDIACHVRHVDIDDVTHAAPQSIADGGMKMKFLQCIKTGPQYQVTMECSAERQDLFMQFIQDQRARVRLLDAKGSELTNAGMGIGLNQQLYTMTYNFNEQDPSHPNGPAMVARHLVWNLPSDVRTIDLPIDFKKMNLRIEGN